MFAARIAIGLTFMLIACAAGAQPPSGRSAQREKRIELQLKSIAPHSVPIFHQATIAYDKSDYGEASRLYQEVLKEAPQFSPALRRLGLLLVFTGNRDDGLTMNERAVQLERSPENLISLAQSLGFPGQGRNGLVATDRVLSLAKEASDKYQDRDDPSYLAFTAQAALSLQRYGEFRDAAGKLAHVYPQALATHYFGAIRAAMDEDWIVAQREIREAERLGLAPASAEEFLDSGVRLRANIRRSLNGVLYVIAGWGGGLLLLFAAGKMLSVAMLRSMDAVGPDGLATGAELALRRCYRTLIRFAGMYYYVSLPVVLVLVIGGTAGLLYGFVMLGQIPIRLAFVLVVGALVTSFKMVQSLFIQVKSEDPGRSLEPAEAGGLWDLARDVADTVGTRPIDEIRVTWGTEMAVYERGTVRERRQDQGRRILVLGVGLLDDFRQGPFCAVLAHEYGHFSHRDTAGGDIALRVRQDMMKFAVAMVQHGQAVWWNLAFQFVRLYFFLFRRITHGATRLQEVLADRVAARHYGATHFEEGLRHVVRRNIEFAFSANREIRYALEGRRALQNLYGRPVLTTPGVDAEVEAALARPASEDDTHPGPVERFRLLKGLVAQDVRSPSGKVWDLFANPETLMTEMTAVIDSRVQLVAESQGLGDVQA